MAVEKPSTPYTNADSMLGLQYSHQERAVVRDIDDTAMLIMKKVSGEISAEVLAAALAIRRGEFVRGIFRSQDLRVKLEERGLDPQVFVRKRIV